MCQSPTPPKKPSTPFLTPAFLLSIREVEPNYQVEAPHWNRVGYFIPSNNRAAFDGSAEEKLFRYYDGRFRSINTDDAGWRRGPGLAQKATVFSGAGGEAPTEHLIATHHDVTVEDVPPDQRSGWKTLQFRSWPNHEKGPTYSVVDLLSGHEGCIAATGPDHLVEQVIPRCYDYRTPRGCRSTERTFAGLIGNLPILIAMLAFSGPPEHLVSILENCLRDNRWHRHGHPTGRKSCSYGREQSLPFPGEPDRGMVVKIYHDPSHADTSTTQNLAQLSACRFGPFINAQKPALQNIR